MKRGKLIKFKKDAAYGNLEVHISGDNFIYPYPFEGLSLGQVMSLFLSLDEFVPLPIVTWGSLDVIEAFNKMESSLSPIVNLAKKRITLEGENKICFLFRENEMSVREGDSYYDMAHFYYYKLEDRDE